MCVFGWSIGKKHVLKSHFGSMFLTHMQLHIHNTSHSTSKSATVGMDTGLISNFAEGPTSAEGVNVKGLKQNVQILGITIQTT